MEQHREDFAQDRIDAMLPNGLIVSVKLRRDFSDGLILSLAQSTNSLTLVHFAPTAGFAFQSDLYRFPNG